MTIKNNFTDKQAKTFKEVFYHLIYCKKEEKDCKTCTLLEVSKIAKKLEELDKKL